jgi:hypothetical protein
MVAIVVANGPGHGSTQEKDGERGSREHAPDEELSGHVSRRESYSRETARSRESGEAKKERQHGERDPHVGGGHSAEWGKQVRKELERAGSEAKGKETALPWVEDRKIGAQVPDQLITEAERYTEEAEKEQSSV